jgi:hypothetical protein
MGKAGAFLCPTKRPDYDTDHGVAEAGAFLPRPFLRSRFAIVAAAKLISMSLLLMTAIAGNRRHRIGIHF